MFLAETGINPFQRALTIASACNQVFRTKYLEEETIGIVPHGGYRKAEKQSLIAIKWLKWTSYIEKIQIRHAMNMGELKIGSYKVDGLHGKTVYEFHGCWWHGCPKCMKRRHQLTADQILTAEEAYQRTVKRKQYIEDKGYTVIEMWECTLNFELKKNLEMKEHFDNIKIIDPLDPREAFYGGRTNAIKLYHKIKTDSAGNPLEKINYTDICSLYPTVNKYGIYPIGHPEIITENFEKITKNDRPYEGLIKTKILPPRSLYHPILPYRFGGKLYFPLCKTCAEKNQQEMCNHDEEERAIVGAWVTLEIYKALENGYKIQEIYEVWHYEETEQYDKEENPSGGLFTTYINKFMKLKQEADGWPSWVQSGEDRDLYIKQYEEREGIQLDAAKIKKNPGMRSLAKLMLNSFWGKVMSIQAILKIYLIKNEILFSVWTKK